MPSSRQTRGRARQRLRADPETRPCQALLPDKKTSCTSHAHDQGRYCTAHGREYGQLTKAYKDASDGVDALEEEIQHLMERVDALDSIAALDTAVASASQFLDALGEEISGRETHHKRFFQAGELEKNHEKWLKRRKKQEAAAMRLLERLQKRREYAIATEVAAKADEERRREIESLAQHTAIAEAQLRAVEEAQRKANEYQARWRVVENERIRSIAEAQRTAAQGRSVLDERTNTTSSNQKDAGPKSDWVPPTGPRSSVAPLPHPLYQAPLPQYPPPTHGTYYSTRHAQNTGESRPPMRSAGTIRIPVSVAPSISSWPVDIERQAAPAARANWQAHPERTTLRYEVSVDCEFIRTALFWVLTFSVFCYLVVVEGLRRSYRLVLASGFF